MTTRRHDDSRVSIQRATRSDAPALAGLIRSAFQDVARRFDLSAQNAPAHPSNCEPSWIVAELERGVSYYACSAGDMLLGCIAVAPVSAEVAELKRLAVLPEARRGGVGRQLVCHGLEQARSDCVRRVIVGVIAGHTELVTWYLSLGFLATHTRRYPQLPFAVAYLEHAL